MLAVTLIVSPQLLAGAFGWGIAIITGMVAATCLAVARAARRDGSPFTAGAVGVAAGGSLLWTLLQAAPLPRGLTAWIQPWAVDLADEGARLLGDPPADWISLSIAPALTWAQVVQGVGVVGAFFAATTLASLGHRRRVFQAVGASSLILACVALLHLAAGTDKVFGIYAPEHDTSPLLSPIVNQNALSGFLAMGVPVLLGLGLDSRVVRDRRLWFAGAILVSICSLMAVSRGGAAALVVAFLSLALFGIVRRVRASSDDRNAKRPGGSRSSLALIGVSALVAGGLGLYLAGESLYHDFEGSGVENIELAARAMGLAFEHPYVGVGRGAFSAAFVGSFGETLRATHAENTVAQWCAEWGLTVGLGLVAVIGYALLRTAREGRSWAQLGGAAGLIALFVRDMTESTLELAGIAVVAAALLGATVSAPSGGRTSRRRRSKRFTQWRLTAALGAAGLVLAVLPGATIDADSVAELTQTLVAQMRSGDQDGFRATLVRAVRLHPSEPTFSLLGGAEAGQRDDPSALQWLNRTMVLAPGWPAPHVEAARILTRRGSFAQALLEVRIAAEHGDLGHAADTACPALRRNPEQAAQLALREFGDDPLGERVLDRMAQCAPRGGGARSRIDAFLVAHDVGSARLRAAQEALSADRPEEALRLLDSVSSEAPQVLITRARAHLAADEPAEALEALGSREGPDDLLRVRARAEAAAGSQESMLATIELLRTRAAGAPAGIAAAWLLQGNLLEDLGQDFDAMHAYGRAQRIDPSSGGLRRTAALAERLGDRRRAFRAWSELCRLARRDSPACRSRDEALSRLREPTAPSRQLLPTP